MSTDVNYKGRKRKFLQWLVTDKHERIPPTQKMLAKEFGVRPETLCRWKRDDEFMRAVKTMARQEMGDELPQVLKALTREAVKGSIAHIRTYLEYVGEMDQQDHVVRLLVEYANLQDRDPGAA